MDSDGKGIGLAGFKVCQRIGGLETHVDAGRYFPRRLPVVELIAPYLGGVIVEVIPSEGDLFS
jgi:hypothetical protein